MNFFNRNRGRGKGKGGAKGNQHLGVRGDMGPEISFHFKENSQLLRELSRFEMTNILGLPQNQPEAHPLSQKLLSVAYSC